MSNSIERDDKNGQYAKRCHNANIRYTIYFELVYFVTALVPSDTACLANSPGRRRRTAVWISREVIVDLEIGNASKATT